MDISSRTWDIRAELLSRYLQIRDLQGLARPEREFRLRLAAPPTAARPSPAPLSTLQLHVPDMEGHPRHVIKCIAFSIVFSEGRVVSVYALRVKIPGKVDKKTVTVEWLLGEVEGKYNFFL